MAADPEFFLAHILVTRNQVLAGIYVHDGRELFHLVPLGVDLANGFLVCLDGIQIEAGRVEMHFGRHGRLLSVEARKRRRAGLSIPKWSYGFKKELRSVIITPHVITTLKIL
jgi:hypothetical protein